MRFLKILLLCIVTLSSLTACMTPKDDNKKVIIYSNADDEAIEAIKKALNNNGFKGQYILQSLGTSELGGRMVTEGQHIEADIITQASYFIDNAQVQNKMFEDINSPNETIEKHPRYSVPLLRNVGALFINTKAIQKAGLPEPKTLKDLTHKVYENQLSFPSIMGSSTGWLFIQAVINEYGEKEGKVILAKLIKNAGPHLESSGSGPIKKVQTGEVAVGFGLRVQSIKAEKEGLPIKTIDPVEGNFTLQESIAVVKKKRTSQKEKRIAKMIQVIQKDGRSQIIQSYTEPLYKREYAPIQSKPKYLKQWKTPLNVDLLEKHQRVFKESSIQTK